MHVAMLTKFTPVDEVSKTGVSRRFVSRRWRLEPSKACSYNFWGGGCWTPHKNGFLNLKFYFLVLNTPKSSNCCLIEVHRGPVHAKHRTAVYRRMFTDGIICTCVCALRNGHFILLQKFRQRVDLFMVSIVLQCIEGCSQMASFVHVYVLSEMVVSSCSKKFRQRWFIIYRNLTEFSHQNRKQNTPSY